VLNHDTGVATCYTNLGVKYGSGCNFPSYGKMNAIGLIGGVQAGYNWQLGPLVIGPELEYDGTTLNGSSNFSGLGRFFGGSAAQLQFTATEAMTSFQSERLRVGFASGRTLIYATGGWAQSNWNLMSNTTCGPCTAGGISFPGSISVARSGFTEGLGGEWAVTPHMTFKVEGLLYEMQPYTTRFAEIPNFGYTAGKDFYFHGAIARIGFNWRL
jgi:outer membrane immunogenic protein